MILTACVYAPTLRYPYVYEDQHPDFFAPWGGWRAELWMNRLAHPTRLLTHLSYLATHALSSNQPWGDHLGNLCVHVVNVSLLAAAVAPVLGVAVAGFAAVCFALHPAQAEAVAYVSSRPDLLVGTGILLALCGVTYRRAVLLAAGVVLAGLSKETGLMALPLALLWAWQTGQALPSRRALLVTGGILAIVAGALVRQFGPIVAGPDEISAHLTMLWRLLALVVVPVGFAIDHEWLWITPKIAAFGTLAWLAVLACSLREHRPWLGFAAIWTLMVLAPRLLAHEPEPLHEHHLYAPMVGLSIAGAALFSRLSRYLKGPSHACART